MNSKLEIGLCLSSLLGKELRFRKRGKLNHGFIEPLEILDKIGPVSYWLRLPQELNNVHDVFHVSNLNKCLFDDSLVIHLDRIQINLELNFVKEPVEIMDKDVKLLK